ncbi:Phosphoglycolate phosphatase [hydrothermal vent metagenome]|uniref:Phosphoglycolate phosphatase n=1 Tax=hydrothermal vent metagenome TaxID=652676 RepID=A0A3B1E6T7_9ZZZZ
MKKIILFDLDGTLIDSTDAIISCFYHSFEKFNFNFQGTKEDIKNEIGYPLEIMYETFGVHKNKVPDFMKIYKNEYRKISLSQTTLLPRAMEAINLASSFARLGVVTTKTTKYTIPLLENMNIMKFFEVIIGRQEVENPKPHPEPILKAMKAMNVTNGNHDIFMIGDTKLDLISAHYANIQGVGVLCGHGKLNELEQYSSMIYCDTLESIKMIRKSSK